MAYPSPQFPLHIALVVGPDCDLEAQVIRSALDLLPNNRLTTYFIGRPQEFIDILSGKALYQETTHIILCFHGKACNFVMPKLAEEVYYSQEPKGDFGPEEILTFSRFNGCTILTTGCGLGQEKLANVFLHKGAETYIAPVNDIDGSAAWMFVTRFYYELLNKQKNIDSAFKQGISIDRETQIYRKYPF